MSAPPLDVDAVAAPAFALVEDHGPFRGDAHAHRRHQLLYARSGTLHLEVEGARWLLPPARAAWIGGGVEHRVDAPGPVALRTVYVDPSLGGPAVACCVFAVSDLARELILLATRFGPADPPSPLRAAVFATLVGLCAEWTAAPLPWHLPVARSPAIGRAMAFAHAHLDGALDHAAAAQAAGLSVRSLSRHFAAETGMTWRRYVLTARMLHAMELLGAPDARVSEVALAVGYDSFAAFSHAFRGFTGESPSAWRARAGVSGARRRPSTGRSGR
ncbi:MAG: helix-turn-helix transcriptional regulator [Myxococcales bacterium]|nr:helix-turn-helix transcriptional regulator [Myxococcales bacterium]